MILCSGTALAASPVPLELYSQVDHGIRPATVLADPEAYRGRLLLIGGMVERTVSEPSFVTMEISCYLMTEDDRPERPDSALGRVLVWGTGLDGSRLQPGRLVTVVGEVTGRDPSGATRLPALAAGFIHPWPTAEELAAEEAASRELRGYSPWCDPWFYDPWCGPWYYGPYPRWRFGAGIYQHWH